MKINFEVKKERSKVDKCIRHLDATMDLFGNSIKSIEKTERNNLYWAVIELVNRQEKSINQRYSFSSEGERDIFINRLIEEYQEM
jgi:hypothetical protein